MREDSFTLVLLPEVSPNSPDLFTYKEQRFREKGMGNYGLTDREFQLYKMKSAGDGWRAWLHRHDRDLANPDRPHTGSGKARLSAVTRPPHQVSPLGCLVHPHLFRTPLHTRRDPCAPGPRHLASSCISNSRHAAHIRDSAPIRG